VATIHLLTPVLPEGAQYRTRRDGTGWERAEKKEMGEVGKDEKKG
jgi:hypothetical protein